MKNHIYSNSFKLSTGINQIPKVANTQKMRTNNCLPYQAKIFKMKNNMNNAKNMPKVDYFTDNSI